MAGLQETLPDFSKRNFLVIDDFHGMQGILREILHECGTKNIHTASNGKDALRLLASNKYDVVLCDFNLGAGKNGQQILEEAKFRSWIGPACAWIMITAEKSFEMAMGALEYQPDCYLLKPVTTAVLQNRLAKIWAKKNAFIDINKAMLKKNYPKAIALCDEQLAYDKLNVAELQRLKYQFLIAIGDLPGAHKHLDAVLAEREQPWASVGMGKVLFLEGKLPEARRLLQNVINENNSNIEAYDLLAKVLQQMNQLDAAEAIMQRAVQLSPNSPQRQRELGELALMRGNIETAERAFRKSVAVGEFSILKHPDTYVGLAKVCGIKQQPNEALNALGTMQKFFDGDEIALRAKAVEGLVYLHSNQPHKAKETVAALSAMLSNSAGVPSNKVGLEAAEFLLNADHKDAAADLLKKLVMNNHDDSSLANQVGKLFDQAGMHEEGAQLVDLSRKQALDLMNAGVLLAQAGKMEESIESMRNAKNLLPANQRVLLNFSHIVLTYLKKEGYSPALVEEAERCLDRVRQINPEDKRLNTLTLLYEEFVSQNSMYRTTA